MPAVLTELGRHSRFAADDALLGGHVAGGARGRGEPGRLVDALGEPQVGDEHAAIWFFGVCLLATVVLVVFGPDPEQQFAPIKARGGSDAGAKETAEELDEEDTGEAITGSIRVPGSRESVFAVAWRYRAVLSRLGVAAASLCRVTKRMR